MFFVNLDCEKNNYHNQSIIDYLTSLKIQDMISSVCDLVMLLPALWIADEFEGQGLHGNYNKWIGAFLYTLS